MANNNYKSKYDVSGAIADYAKTAGEGFNYDPTTDAAYQSYAKEYARLGEKARQNTLGDVASLTGGYASSYATSAAAQAQNDYNRQLTAVIPELQNAAYNRWSDQLSNQYNYAGLLMNADAAGYDRWAANRAFNYQKDRDKVADAQWEKEYLLSKKASESSGRSSGGGSRGGNRGGSYSGGGNGDPVLDGGNNDKGNGTPKVKPNGITGTLQKIAINTKKSVADKNGTKLNGKKYDSAAKMDNYLNGLYKASGQKSLAAAKIYLKANGITKASEINRMLKSAGYVIV